MNSFASNMASKNGARRLPLATGEEPAVDEHPLLFPSVLRHVAPFNEGNGHVIIYRFACQWTISHAGVSRKFRAVGDRTLARRRAGAVSFHAAKDRAARIPMDMVSAQDSMAWETQGAADRPRSRTPRRR